jgi:hypothetical protein
LIYLIKRLSNAWYVGSPGLTPLTDELQECKTGLARELSLWKDQAALESEVNQLKETLQEAQKDNRKLEQTCPGVEVDSGEVWELHSRVLRRSKQDLGDVRGT